MPILVAIDSETHLVRAGLLTPRIVCGTVAFDGAAAELTLREEWLQSLEMLLLAPDVELCGANVAYDFACASALRPELLKLIFDAYDAGRVFDILLGAALIDIEDGCLGKDPKTHQPFKAYSQGMLEKRYLGVDRSVQKTAVKTDRETGLTAEELEDMDPDAWRLRYGELDDVPLDQWPDAAKTYPMDDARYCWQIAVEEKRIGKNLSQMTEQARGAFGLHLSAVWGMRTDPGIVAEVAGEIEAAHLEAVAKFSGCGIYRADGTQNKSVVKRLVVLAYGVQIDNPCPECKGTGKAPSSKQSQVICTACKAAAKLDAAAPCAVCNGTRKMNSTHVKYINCPKCDATGLNCEGVPVPLTDKGAISTDRDTLAESGDETLEEFSETGENEKWRTTYLAILRRGTQLPINPTINPLLETGRCAMRNPSLQTLPRKGRVRECFVPRAVQYEVVEAPDSYALQPGERT